MLCISAIAAFTFNALSLPRKSPAGMFVVLFLLIAVPLRSQEFNSLPSVVVEDLIEKIAQESEEELDYQTLFADLYRYLESPLNLNTATRENLERLHLLTDFQILSLQKYIRENGPLLSIYELPLVHGFDESLARAIEPMVILIPPDREMPGDTRKIIQDLLVRVSSVLEDQEGYSDISDSALAANPNARYTGNRLRIMTKYRFRSGDKWMVGYNGDKDPGEPFFAGKNKKGFDFNSMYFQVNDVWKFKRILAGDYKAQAGQGLSLWSGLAFGKSPDIVNTRKKGNVLVPSTSVDENRFMRGVAATVGLGEFDITGFFSFKKIDANLIEDSLAEERAFSSFQTSGYHRTPREFDDKDAVAETVVGGNITWNHNRIRIGASFLQYHFDAINRSLSPMIYSPGSGSNSNSNMGVDYTIGMNRVILFGELSYSLNTGSGDFLDAAAIINGASFELHPQVSLSLIHRYLGMGFYAQYGNAFRENPFNSNENGIYMGIEVRPIPHWVLTGYLDAYRFPGLAKLTADRNSGFDYFLQAEYTDRDRLNGYLRYRYKIRPENLNSINRVGSDDEVPHKSQLRFNISYRVGETITFQDRLELSFYDKDEKENGWLAYHDILFRPHSFPLSFTFRYAMFDTEGYNSRIYTYEHDVLYAFSTPTWYGRGIRTYLNTRLDLGRHVDLWFKYALSWYPERESIGTGLNEINRHHRQDIHVQMRLKF